MNLPKIKQFSDWMRMGWILVLIMLIQGCGTFTYPSPQPVSGPQITSLDLSGISCFNSIRGATRGHIAFSLDGTVDFCFTSPLMGYYKNENLTYGIPCTLGAIGGVRGDASRLVFEVYVRGHEVDLGVNQAIGMLETKERSTTAMAIVEPRKFLDMPPGTNIDGKLRYNVNGAWLSFAEASSYFTRTAYMMEFDFDQTCNPDANYRLTITGLTAEDHALIVPPVDFVPFSETVPTFD